MNEKELATFEDLGANPVKCMAKISKMGFEESNAVNVSVFLLGLAVVDAIDLGDPSGLRFDVNSEYATSYEDYVSILVRYKLEELSKILINLYVDR
ncbi:hypothetical protein HHI36_013109 [Cryptolaemus montrouzieri]|uniref:Uncharacterized protein n=1 Tax=Cryptolaemus montrouzieri TaxID=559131 RepID=A0ABD2NGW3_9CUCU